MVYYNKTAASEGIDVNKSNESKECIFVTIDIFEIRVLVVKCMSVMIVVIY